MRRTAVAVVLGVVLGACAPAAPSDNDDEASADNGATPTEATEQTPAPSSLATDDPAVRDAILLTAVDEVLAGTRFADLVDDDPGAFLETADTVCRGLAAGSDADTVLAGLLLALEDEGLSLDEDTAYLGGAVLGAAVTIRCPEHEGAITGVGP